MVSFLFDRQNDCFFKRYDVSFFVAKERDAKKGAKGDYGLVTRSKAKLSTSLHKPLSPLESPNTPLGESFALLTEGEFHAAFLRWFLQLLFVGTPTEIVGGEGRRCLLLRTV